MDARLSVHDPQGVIAEAQEYEAAGYTGYFSAEAAHDPYLPLALAAAHTDRIQLGTAIAVAFARSPMQMAYVAHELQACCRGRFILGLGSQVKAHIERRYDMPWSRPAARMREYVRAIKAIWSCWDTGESLDFRGDFYSHTLMTPFFAPPPNPTAPQIFVAAVGEYMTAIAGEVADGVLTHGLSTARYLCDVTLPALNHGLRVAGRKRDDIAVSYLGFVATGRNEEEMAAACQGVRRRIGFYASTPAYRGVLAVHGWEDLHTELAALARSGRDDRWARMGDCIDHEVLHTFAVVAEPQQVADEIWRRFGGLVDRFSFYTPYSSDFKMWIPIVAELRQRSRVPSKVPAAIDDGGGEKGWS
ncbi:LLM class F420-dependent oxidoreductase [Mycobacterium arosiense ATCC BAA-1401 = DSM 45069]|uniref:LLM class F420-dependent oxidoreductase n=1 Tax=Mycobacterium arosiense ATCC BAA-1401 = DSM 45069 TaxID=1265311 RepID=A0A1W9ZBX2_MYCAI|nr:LLM class F420-dependent oxidoreductase [Mycobacterium arosiense ATCC BAA-1401 = DSM 45069]